MDDSGNGYGADVLFALNRNGYSNYIRLIHEKGKFNRGVDKAG